ncbi:MAG: hypothetical protein IJ710_00410 [Prevotella sp.]|nr:hypothetical protein [Prevotella sp.]
MIHTTDDIGRLISERGFLPFFAGGIPDFSLEEVTPPELWFPDDTIEGVWEWKGRVILDNDCAYGKFYQQKACFVSMEWFPHLANYRRSCYRLTADEQRLLATLAEHHSLLSKELKRLCGYVKPRQPHSSNPLDKVLTAETRAAVRQERPRRQSFDTAITRLQMAAYVVTADFEYLYDKQGRRYGWGVARYCTPEDFFGPERMQVDCSPAASRRLLETHLHSRFPQMTDADVQRVLG